MAIAPFAAAVSPQTTGFIRHDREDKIILYPGNAIADTTASLANVVATVQNFDSYLSLTIY